MYQLAVCELFHPYIHGEDNQSSVGITGHYLVYMTMSATDFFSGEYTEELSMVKRHVSSKLAMMRRDKSHKHPIIRNYAALTKNVNRYLTVQIVKSDELQPGGEQVGYMKTFWLKVVQRRWKKVYHRRRAILQARRLPQNMRYRQLYGRWPATLNDWPRMSIYGGPVA